MPEYKQLLGGLAIAISMAGYVPYIIDLIKGKTKPHVFSWLIWGIITITAFFAQTSRGAGAGAWVALFASVMCLLITGYAFFKGEKEITLTDWLSFIGAGLALGLWALTSEPLLAIILVVITDALGFVPTFRKTYFKPQEETMVLYLFSGIKFIVALFALEALNATTVLYPAYLIIANFSFVTMLLIRRRQLAR